MVPEGELRSGNAWHGILKVCFGKCLHAWDKLWSKKWFGFGLVGYFTAARTLALVSVG
jgi:hypothetical protein